MALDPQLVHRIKSSFARLTSEELQGILTKEDRSQWSDEAFEAARRTLEERSRGVLSEPATLSPHDSLWQDSGKLVLRTTAVFPSRCIRCNQSTTALNPLYEIEAPGLIIRCCICSSHIRHSKAAKRIHYWTCVIGLLSFIWLSLSVLLAELDLSRKVVLFLTFAFCAEMFVLAWNSLGAKKVAAELLRKEDSTVMIPYSLIMRYWALQLGCLVTVFALVAILVCCGILIKGWKEGHYLLVLLATIPPVVGTILLLRFRLKWFLSKSQPGFGTLEGVGRSFLLSLPRWPGYPRSTPVTVPGDVGRGS